MVVRVTMPAKLPLRTNFRYQGVAPKWRAGLATIHGASGRISRWVAAYGLHFSGSLHILDLGLLYRALADRQVDLAAGNSTMGLIAALGMVALEDDRRYFPPYEAVPLVRRATLDNHPRPALRSANSQEKITEDESAT